MTDHSVEIWNQIANEMISNGLHEEALYYFDRILSLEPLNSRALDNKAYILEILGRKEEALECIDRYLRYEPSDTVLWIHKGDLLDDSESAIACFNEALKIDPKNEEAWVKKGYILREIGQYAEAARCFEKALRLFEYRPTIPGYPAEYQDSDRAYSRELLEEYRKCLALRGD